MKKQNMLKAYVFDIDDNLRKLSTTIFLQKIDGAWDEVSTERYSQVRMNFKSFGYVDEVDFCKSFVNFRKEKDYLFIDQILTSKPSYSWPDYVECVNNASIYSWCTARGHSKAAFKEASKRMIMSNFEGLDYCSLINNQRTYMDFMNISNINMTDEEVLDYYLNLCKFYGMEDEESSMEVLGIKECHNPSLFKPKAFNAFCEYIKQEFEQLLNNTSEENREALLKQGMHIGFSDDDTGTVSFLVNNISDVINKSFSLKIHIYHTLNGRKKVY